VEIFSVVTSSALAQFRNQGVEPDVHARGEDIYTLSVCAASIDQDVESMSEWKWTRSFKVSCANLLGLLSVT